MMHAILQGAFAHVVLTNESEDYIDLNDNGAPEGHGEQDERGKKPPYLWEKSVSGSQKLNIIYNITTLVVLTEGLFHQGWPAKS